MCSVMNEAEPFKAAAVAGAWEQMSTAGNVSASATPDMSTQKTCSACAGLARRSGEPAGADQSKRRNVLLVTGKSFLHAVFIVQWRSSSDTVQ